MTALKGSFRPSGPLTLDADAVIIGSGAGGASVADILTSAGLSVIILEEGPHVPAEAASPWASTAFQQSWRCGGYTAALGSPPIAYAEGRSVGGGTEINSAIAQSPGPDVIAGWTKRFGIADFSPDVMAGYLTRAATAINASLTPPPLGAPTEILRRGGAALGWEVRELQRGQRGCKGANRCSFGCPNAAKQSMATTLLPRAVARGARLIAHTRVRKLVMTGNRVVRVEGVAAAAGGRNVAVRVRAAQVFCCAGAIHTPALLHRSGMKRNIGRSLQLHPTMKVIAQFPEVVDAHVSRLPLMAVTEFMPEMRLGGSLFTPALFALSLAEDWGRRKALMPQWRHCTSYYAMIRPRGLGRVRTVPFAAEPVVTYRLAPEDWVSLRLALTRLGELMFAAGAHHVVPSITGHPGWRSLDDVRQEAEQPLPQRLTNLMSIHLFSSCPPGETQELTALDSYGRVRGVENLYVADASQIPSAPGVNPQVLVMAMAMRTAEAALAHSSAEQSRRAAREASG